MAANRVVRTVVDFLPDAAGHRQFFGITSRTTGELNGQAAVIAAPQSSSWFAGPVVQPRATGRADAVAQGRARVIAPRSSELMHQNTTKDAVTNDVFRSRLMRDAR